jgi:hypothetical protein
MSDRIGVILDAAQVTRTICIAGFPDQQLR